MTFYDKKAIILWYAKPRFGLEPGPKGRILMRVITGTARGRKLIAPEGLETRPTSDMAKEAMFSIVQFEVAGARVLDLFAGSGQIGIEALSRGASGAVFVDSSKAARDAILFNLKSTGFEGRSALVFAEAESCLKSCRDRFDLVFLDPPYQSGLVERCLPLVAGLVRPGGVILCETARDETTPEAAGVFGRKKEYRYGKAKVTTFRRGEESY